MAGYISVRSKIILEKQQIINQYFLTAIMKPFVKLFGFKAQYFKALPSAQRWNSSL
jgi:hypothetical protein